MSTEIPFEKHLQAIEDLLSRHRIPFHIEAVEDQITGFLNVYRKLPENERSAVRTRLGPDNVRGLLHYAVRRAEEAVRDKSVSAIQLGLLAVALEGVQEDYRDTIVVLCLLHHSAKKIGADPAVLFEEATLYGNKHAEELILGYLARGDKDIGAMGKEESVGLEGFRYASI